MSRIPDRRFTVSVSAELADKLDEYVSHKEKVTRSGVVEEALRLWESLAQYPDKDQVLKEAMHLYAQQQERELYRSYYAELSDAARAEDQEWTELSQESASQRWPAPNANVVRNQGS